MAEKAGVVVVGSNVTDLIGYTPRLPNPGETLRGHKFAMGFGGKGANQAAQAALLGGQVSMVTKVGDDSFGTNTLQNFKDKGVNTDHVTVEKGVASGAALICVDAQGTNDIVIIPGACDCLKPDHVKSPAISQRISSSKVLLCQLEIPLETTVAALQVAKENGVFSVLNTAPAPPDPSILTNEILSLATVICPNESELTGLTGLPTNTMDEVKAAAAKLSSRAAGALILVTLGKSGCLLLSSPTETKHFPVAPVQAIDTTGAGDSFLGALAHFVASGLSLEEAIPKANVVASLSVQKEGTQSSYPSAKEVEGKL